MCKSICQGTCMLSLKDKVIDSKESLINVINVLDTLSTCSTSVDEHSNDSGKNNSMNEITNLKTEAKRLLYEVNNKIERSPDGKEILNSPYGIEYLFEERSFKERLLQLKQKIALLQISLSNHPTIT